MVQGLYIQERKTTNSSQLYFKINIITYLAVGHVQKVNILVRNYSIFQELRVINKNQYINSSAHLFPQDKL